MSMVLNASAVIEVLGADINVVVRSNVICSFSIGSCRESAASAATLLNATVAAGEIVPLWLRRRTSSIAVVLLGRHRLRDLRFGAAAHIETMQGYSPCPLLLLQRPPSIGFTTTTKTPSSAMVINFNFQFQPTRGAAYKEEPTKNGLLDWMAQDIYVAQKNLCGSSGSYTNYLLRNSYSVWRY